MVLTSEVGKLRITEYQITRKIKAESRNGKPGTVNGKL